MINYSYVAENRDFAVSKDLIGTYVSRNEMQCDSLFSEERDYSLKYQSYQLVTYSLQ